MNTASDELVERLRTVPLDSNAARVAMSEAAQEIERFREALEYICHQDGKGADGLIDWQRCVDRIQEVARSALTPSIKRG